MWRGKLIYLMGFSDYGTGSHCVSVVITTVFPACRHQLWCEKSSDSEYKTFILKKKKLLPKDTHHILSPAYCCFSWHVPHPKLSLIQRWPCKRVGVFFFFLLSSLFPVKICWWVYFVVSHLLSDQKEVCHYPVKAFVKLQIKRSHSNLPNKWGQNKQCIMGRKEAG